MRIALALAERTWCRCLCLRRRGERSSACGGSGGGGGSGTGAARCSGFEPCRAGKSALGRKPRQPQAEQRRGAIPTTRANVSNALLEREEWMSMLPHLGQVLVKTGR